MNLKEGLERGRARLDALQAAMQAMDTKMALLGYEINATVGWQDRTDPGKMPHLWGKISTWHSDKGSAKVVIYDNNGRWDYVIYKETERGRVEPLTFSPLPAPDMGDHMTLEVFKQGMDCALYTDDDGFGELATATQVSDVRIVPSNFADPGFKQPDWATHVVWFNK